MSIDQVPTEVLQSFDKDGVYAVWEKALARRDADPEGAITLARTLLETVCKRILEECGVAHSENDDLPRLYSKVAQVLDLAPNQHTERPIKAILGSAMNLVNGIGTLRNRLSDSHGRGGRQPERASPRHAHLAVNTAGAMSAFLIETLLEQEMYWNREASEAAAYAHRVLFESHRGAVLWRPGVVAIFGNDGSMQKPEKPYVKILKECLVGIDFLGMGFAEENYTWAMLCRYGNARTLHNLVWGVFVEEAPISLEEASGAEIDGVQGRISRHAAGTHFHVPVRE